MSDPTRQAELQWDEEGQPVSSQFGDVYFSKLNGLEETRHVFLQHNQLPERFGGLGAHDVFSIGETGFGSGLNFLAAWQLWRQTANPTARLHFISAEKYPLSPADLQKSLSLWPELSDLADSLIAQYPAFLHTGFHRVLFDEGKVQLTLMIGDAADMFCQLSTRQLHHHQAIIDAWFLDGFAPAKNPEMWTDTLFAAIRQLSGTDTTAATFSAAGIVKRGLRGAGFKVKKVPGFGRKREMVKAVVAPPAPSADPITNDAPVADLPPLPAEPGWSLTHQAETYSQRSALVIGGGLAGCHTAYALACRGWQVTLLERDHHIANGASGNLQGIVYARLSPKLETQALFNLSCLQYALRYYAPFWQDESIGSACGVLQLASDDNEQRWQDSLKPLFDNYPALVQFVDQQQASQLAGIALQHGGLHFPDAGWIAPQRLCEILTSHPNVRTLTSTNIIELSQYIDGWQARDSSGQLHQANVAIIANAHEASLFSQSQHLPMKAIRGQTTWLSATERTRGVQRVICAEGYFSPATGTPATHCAGATFSLNDDDRKIRAEDHQHNLDNLNTLLGPEHRVESTQISGGRVCFRAATPDYLPMVGQLPQYDAFLHDYSLLRKDAKTEIATPGKYWPGLFVNVGHGSRGLAYTPLCAELLACQINNEPLPVDKQLARALHPGRFIIRNLMRKRV